MTYGYLEQISASDVINASVAKVTMIQLIAGPVNSDRHVYTPANLPSPVDQCDWTTRDETVCDGGSDAKG